MRHDLYRALERRSTRTLAKWYMELINWRWPVALRSMLTKRFSGVKPNDDNAAEVSEEIQAICGWRLIRQTNEVK